ncbi:TonB-dependent receptor [Roseospira visakhapatnamensis]|uniref:Outer membrane receptor protein involved in Fe transport n=1 Tax=Roseospira visakhapatnamensis TaxID=390880 RepID=A0A7W6RGB9_9PROT|nr:TonB-dependent receptor [Roseospira visakhapatnamensis]MBB4268059.1 outer membrane receptor protein involved in Fe transport [Roseospira visakhapatnamensis]
MPDFLVFKDPMLTSTIRNQYVGERPGDPENNFDLDSYHKLDVRVGLSTDNAELYFRADNLLDDHYDLYGYYYSAMIPGRSDASIGGPARGRSFVVGAAYHF